MKIFGFLFLFISLPVFFACSENSVGSHKVIENDAIFGWLDGGFAPNVDPIVVEAFKK